MESMDDAQEPARKISTGKRITIGIAVALFTLGLFRCCTEMLFRYRLEQIKEMGYTEYNLSWERLVSLRRNFYITVPGVRDDHVEDVYLFVQSTQYSKDKTKFTLTAGSKTEERVRLFNKLLLESEYASEKAREYGITEETPATVDWVLTHPNEALDIISADHLIMRELAVSGGLY